MRTPRSLDLEITSRCNLRCRYCYYFQNEAVDYRDLPTREWLEFFEELGRCAVMNVTLQGGEPFLRDDLESLIRGIAANRMRFTILTNGTLIDDRIAAFIAGTGRCTTVQVSVDGSCAETHDASRGPGAFARTVAGIKALQRNGAPVSCRVTVTRRNVDDLENTARFLLEELGLSAFGTNAAGYLGTCRTNARDMLLSVEERTRAMQTLTRLAEKYEGRISASAGPLAEARHWRGMEEARRARAPADSNGGRLTGCNCHANSMAVRADGAMVPCVMLAHLEMGRINRDPLERVWQDSPVLRRLRQRGSIPLDRFEFCGDCAYVPYCTGNCPALAYTLTGEIDHPSPNACLREFLRAGGQVPGMGDAT